MIELIPSNSLNPVDGSYPPDLDIEFESIIWVGDRPPPKFPPLGVWIDTGTTDDQWYEDRKRRGRP